jgi:UDP-N-acetylglucosamine 2-epimerase (non-hydrolysing)
MKLRVFLVAGARPNFMKIAPIYHEMKRHDEQFEPVVVHTGQHYDENMSKVFFEDLELPMPDLYLGVGSGTHGEQTAEIMKCFEPALKEYNPHLVLVVGDVNSTIACALITAKTPIASTELSDFWERYETFLSKRVDAMVAVQRSNDHRVPLIAHVEAGERSFDWSMPEEINRVTTDVLSQLLFTTSQDADDHLLAEGVDARKIFRVGNIMIDSLKKLRSKADNSKILNELNASHLPENIESLRAREYALATLHRAGNVDDPGSLSLILSALIRVSEKTAVIFPVHPRTHKLMASLDADLQERLSLSRMVASPPMSYLDFLHLQSNALLVLTDSGGVQVETSYLGVPCLTLRPNTEWKVTLTQGTNQLVSLIEGDIVQAATKALDDQRSSAAEIDLWDGRTAGRVVAQLIQIFKPA